MYSICWPCRPTFWNACKDKFSILRNRVSSTLKRSLFVAFCQNMYGQFWKQFYYILHYIVKRVRFIVINTTSNVKHYILRQNSVLLLKYSRLIWACLIIGALTQNCVTQTESHKSGILTDVTDSVQNTIKNAVKVYRTQQPHCSNNITCEMKNDENDTKERNRTDKDIKIKREKLR
jgi:hypothetical protein